MSKRRSSSGKKDKYHVLDEKTKEAHKKGFVARSIFKLEEIDQRVRLYRRGMRVLDLGSAPGSWMQYAAEKVNGKETSYVLGLDIVPLNIALSPCMDFVEGDLFDAKACHESILERSDLPFDLVQSDAMVKTTGIVDQDCARSIDLVESSLRLVKSNLLKEDGAFIAKIFEGPGFEVFMKDFRMTFKKSKVYKPEAIRKGSRECYLYGVGLR